MRSERQVLEGCLVKPRWAKYYEWYLNYARIVGEQDREKLDAIIPNELVSSILSNSKQKFYLNENQLRSYRFTDDDYELSALDVFERCGGGALDEVLERGSLKIS